MIAIQRLKRYFTDLPRTDGATVVQVTDYLLAELEREEELVLRFESGQRAGRTGTLFVCVNEAEEAPISDVSRSVFRGVLTHLSLRIQQSAKVDVNVYGGAGTLAFELPSKKVVKVQVEFVNSASEQRLALTRVAPLDDPSPTATEPANGSHSSLLGGVLVPVG